MDNVTPPKDDNKLTKTEISGDSVTYQNQF